MDYFVPFAAMQWEAQYAAGPALLLIWHCSMSTLDRKYWMMKIFKASSNLWMRWKLVANHLYIFFRVKIFACVGVYEAWAGQAIVSQCKLCHLTMIGRDLCKILWNDFTKQWLPSLTGWKCLQRTKRWWRGVWRCRGGQPSGKGQGDGDKSWKLSHLGSEYLKSCQEACLLTASWEILTREGMFMQPFVLMPNLSKVVQPVAAWILECCSPQLGPGDSCDIELTTCWEILTMKRYFHADFHCMAAQGGLPNDRSYQQCLL